MTIRNQVFTWYHLIIGSPLNISMQNICAKFVHFLCQQSFRTWVWCYSSRLLTLCSKQPKQQLICVRELPKTSDENWKAWKNHYLHSAQIRLVLEDSAQTQEDLTEYRGLELMTFFSDIYVAEEKTQRKYYFTRWALEWRNLFYSHPNLVQMSCMEDEQMGPCSKWLLK